MNPASIKQALIESAVRLDHPIPLGGGRGGRGGGGRGEGRGGGREEGREGGREEGGDGRGGYRAGSGVDSGGQYVESGVDSVDSDGDGGGGDGDDGWGGGRHSPFMQGSYKPLYQNGDHEGWKGWNKGEFERGEEGENEREWEGEREGEREGESEGETMYEQGPGLLDLPRAADALLRIVADPRPSFHPATINLVEDCPYVENIR